MMSGENALLVNFLHAGVKRIWLVIVPRDEKYHEDERQGYWCAERIRRKRDRFCLSVSSASIRLIARMQYRSHENARSILRAPLEKRDPGSVKSIFGNYPTVEFSDSLLKPSRRFSHAGMTPARGPLFIPKKRDRGECSPHKKTTKAVFLFGTLGLRRVHRN
jgi:hypothetical protein